MEEIRLPSSRFSPWVSRFLVAWPSLATVWLVLAAVTACSSEAVVRVDGSSTVFPLTERVVSSYREQEPCARVSVGISGSLGGFRKLLEGTVEISGASAPVWGEDGSWERESEAELVRIPVAWDGIVVAVSRDNGWCHALSLQDLRRMWGRAAQGHIVRWDQVRPDFPRRPLRLYGPGVDSGTYTWFMAAVLAPGEASRGDYTASETDSVLVNGVAGDPDALGFFSFASYLSAADRLRPVTVEGSGSSEPGAPSPEAIAGGRYAPLVRRVYLVVKAESLSRPEVTKFLRFYLDQAPVEAPRVGLVALRKEIYREVRRCLERHRVGPGGGPCRFMGGSGAGESAGLEWEGL